MIYITFIRLVLFQYDERESIIQSFFTNASNADKIALERLLDKTRLYLEKNDDVYLEELGDIIHSLILLSSDKTEKIECLPRILVNKVWNRISKMDNWFYEEIRLINCLLYYFPIETVSCF